MTLRPRYSPQCAHARCRSIGSEQLGHEIQLAGRSASCARRLLRFVLEVRRFGTAMPILLPRSHAAVDLQRAKHREPGIAGLDGAGALPGVAVDPALRAEPPAFFI